MTHNTKKVLAAIGFSIVASSANATIADWKNLPEIDHDFTFKMCERWDQNKRVKFESIINSVRDRIEAKFSSSATIRWKHKWGGEQDWSDFTRSHRPFKGFKFLSHFNDTEEEYSPIEEYPPIEEFPPIDTYPPSAVPVPAAIWLFGTGLIGLVGVARRKRS